MNSWVPLLPDESSEPDIDVPLDITRLLTTITDNLVGMIHRSRADAICFMAYVCDRYHKRMRHPGNATAQPPSPNSPPAHTNM